MKPIDKEGKTNNNQMKNKKKINLLKFKDQKWRLNNTIKITSNYLKIRYSNSSKIYKLHSNSKTHSQEKYFNNQTLRR